MGRGDGVFWQIVILAYVFRIVMLGLKLLWHNFFLAIFFGLIAVGLIFFLGF